MDKSDSSRWRRPALAASLLGAAALAGCGGGSDNSGLPNVPDDLAFAPVRECTMADIGATPLTADAGVTVLDVSTGSTGTTADDRPYCLVKVRVEPQVNLWVAMPTANWNGRFRAEGGGGYAGSVGVANDSVRQGFVGVQTDTGHTGSTGEFGMQSPGVPNTQLQIDFAYRSEHLMAVVGKQLTRAYYGRDPVRSYWYGCSTGGRQGLMMAQRFPEDYDAILAGAPAIHWDRFQAAQIWPQVVMKEDLGAPLSAAKRTLVTQRAVAACDPLDGLTDGVADDPRACGYNPATDSTLTTAACTASDGTCLTPAEADAVQKIWAGPRTAAGTPLWFGLERGADLGGLAGANPFQIAVNQPRYWVYLDPNWDWRTLDYANYEAFFNKTVEMVGPVIATDNPDLQAFRERGGKLLMYHGWADNLIMPQGTIRYFGAMQQAMGSGAVGDFSRLYMVPGMGHCSGGAGPNSFGQGRSGVVPMTPERDIFRALMAWSERGLAPQSIVATHFTNNNVTLPVDRTRPLCPYPTVARYQGTGSTNEAASFACVTP
jgi:pimeloyl-ACP methyl ester carboxylesterase